jgi:hypothetical protein
MKMSPFVRSGGAGKIVSSEYGIALNMEVAAAELQEP